LVAILDPEPDEGVSKSERRDDGHIIRPNGFEIEYTIKIIRCDDYVREPFGIYIGICGHEDECFIAFVDS